MKKLIIVLIILTTCFFAGYVYKITQRNIEEGRKLKQLKKNIEYTMYLSAWNNYRRASSERDLLMKEGYNTYIESVVLPSDPPTKWHQVYIRGYKSLDAVKKAYFALKEKGMSPSVKMSWEDGYGQRWKKKIRFNH